MPDSEDKKTIIPQWGTPESVWQCTETMQAVETPRALERGKIDTFANGGRPWSKEECDKYNIQLNVNWLELTRKLQDAIGQINNAFIPNGNYFTVHSEGGAPSKKSEYGQKFTKNINNILKRGKSGKRHHFLLRSRNASVALHGPGPLMWTNEHRLFPRFLPLEDLLIPTDTMLDFTTNLTHFAVNLYLTPGELYRMSFLGADDSGWNKTLVTKIMMQIRDDKSVPYFPQQMDEWVERPEAIQELYKQNSGYLESDAVPKTRLRAFFYQDPKTGNWYRKIILRDNVPEGVARTEFIYDSKSRVFAEDINHILHCQFGDNSLVAPLKYHSVRGIGVMLYSASWTLNRVRCQMMQHIFQNLQTWFAINDPSDRDRTKAILLMNNGILPEGARIIPQQERHQVDARLLEFGMAQMKQNISENSTSYAPELDSGTSKERTKFEVQAQLQASSAMIGNVLSMMYAQEIFYYEELVRRALIKNTSDPWAKKFQEACKKDKIPDELMEPGNWRIIPERVLGAGDNALAQAQADALMGQIMSFEPDKQTEIKRLWVSTTLNDPDRAAELVPETDDKSSSGTRAAEELFGTLMLGITLKLRKNIDQVGFCAALLGMMEKKIQEIMAPGEDAMGEPEDISGFMAVIQSVSQSLQYLSQDDRNGPVVKQLGDKMGELGNLLKALIQRQAEAAPKQEEPDPAVMAKIQADGMAAQQKLQINEASAQQKMEQKQQAFEAKLQMQMEQHELRMKTQMEQTQAAIASLRAKSEAELEALGMKTGAEVKSTELKTVADVAATKTKAEATPKKTEKSS